MSLDLAGIFAAGLLTLYALYGLLLAGFLGAALRRRREHTDWPLLENFVIASYLAVTFIESWLSGTQFTGGVLLLFLGVYLTSALADIRKVKIAFHISTLVLAAMAIAQYSGRFAYAPLFTKPPYIANGSPVPGWLFVQVTLVFVLLGLARVSLMAVERWIERENLYREMSTVDGLTRLTNRRSFIERSENEFARARRIPPHGSQEALDADAVAGGLVRVLPRGTRPATGGRLGGVHHVARVAALRQLGAVVRHIQRINGGRRAQ